MSLSGKVDSLAARIGSEIKVVRSSISNVNNTSDAAKPVSTATQTALNAKADLVGGLIPSAQIPSLALV